MAEEFYTERLLNYWDRNRFGWKHDGGYTHQAYRTNDICNDQVEFRLIIRDGILEVVDGWARACCLTECCTAMLIELAQGKSAQWLQALTPEQWKEHVGVSITGDRKYNCVLLPLTCLKEAASDGLRIPLRKTNLAP